MAAVLGLVLGRAAADEGGQAALQTAAAGPVSVEVPEGWRRSTSIPRLGSLHLERPLSIAPASGGGILVGVVRGPGAVFDPRSVAEAVGGSPPGATVVRLGRLQAYRWQGLQAGKPPRHVTLFVAPTGGGAATVACYGGTATAVVPRACGPTAASARLSGVTPYSPVRAAEWRERVRAVIRSLRGRRERELTRLAETLRNSDRARAAMSLANLHRAAKNDLTRASVPPQATPVYREIVTALASLQRSYRDLGRASLRGDAAAYSAAGQAIGRQDAGLRRALRAI